MSDIDDLEEDDLTFNERFVVFLRLWGMAELMLDACVTAIFQYHNGLSVYAEVPVTLERKIKFLRTVADQIPGVTPYADPINQMCDLLSDDKDLRNTVVHGFPLKVEGHKAHFLRPRPTKAGLTYHLRVVTDKDWERLETTSLVAQAMLGSIATQLSPPLDVTFDESEDGMRKWLSHGIANFPASKRVRNLLKEVFAGRTAD